MDSELKNLVEVFKEYTDLLMPIQKNLNDFSLSYNAVKEDVEKLNETFDGNVKKDIEKLSNDMNKQLNSANAISQKIETFMALTEKYNDAMNKLINTFEKTQAKLVHMQEIEQKADEQLSKLDNLLDEKKKSYNVKDLQISLDNYNSNVQKVADFINKDVAESINKNNEKIKEIKENSELINKKLSEENSSIQALINEYNASNLMLKQIIEKNDINEQYIFDILDKWSKNKKK